ncbi:hypothetical protein [Streptomyces flaveolus]|uniref:hypothetical protein n=1 Tax=Streptomyces flaveolus TaxID=67297 RepID=UPI00167014A7|nr:hypothetical protein [Streptomyces flaveolus]GGQ83834.1 hypothetical protein GCM10010216_52150 [Streptomyces flaveolus]
MTEPFRLPAAGPVQAYQTFSVRSRPDQAVRTVCERVGCAAWRQGWDSTVDERTDLGAQQAAYIRTQSGRTFREMKTAAGLTVFRFESGQRCFAEHQTRPELYLVRDGDSRGNPTGRQRVHTRAADWVEHMQEEFGRFNEDRRRG